jgi:hypothetical protein
MIIRLTYYSAAVVIAAMTMIPPVLAEKNSSSGVLINAAGTCEGYGFGKVEIDLKNKPLPKIKRNVIADHGDSCFSRAVASAELQSRNPEGDQKRVACPEPRPQVCTQDYRPVCAMMHDGSFKTYSNGCSACSDPAVTGYREGACEQTDDT